MVGRADLRNNSHVSSPVTTLKVPLDDARAQLGARIELGREQLNGKFLQDAEEPTTGFLDTLTTRFIASQYIRKEGVPPDIDQYRIDFIKWRRENCDWLDRNLGGEVAEMHRGAGSLPKPSNILDWPRWLRESVELEISRLQSIHDRLPYWANNVATSAPAGNRRDPAIDGAIFIVHGSDTMRAELVARAVNRATGRDAVILHEQPSLGQTLIEKFEQHATKVSYAVIVLTPDDEGCRKGDVARRPRGRQNVIFEMGYFYGVIGRNRVSVLLSPGVERPSDIVGIDYIDLDDNGAWKIKLFRELVHAGIQVDMSKI